MVVIGMVAMMSAVGLMGHNCDYGVGGRCGGVEKPDNNYWSSDKSVKSSNDYSSGCFCNFDIL